MQGLVRSEERPEEEGRVQEAVVQEEVEVEVGVGVLVDRKGDSAASMM